MKSAAFAVTCALVATGCSAPPPEASHFPLAAGHRWVYDQVVEMENNTLEHEELVLETTGPDRLDGFDGPLWQRRSASGMDYWLKADASGIYRVASRSAVQDAPQPDSAPRYVLKTPLAVGTNWQASTTAYLLRRRQEFPPEIRHTHAPVTMHYSIEALGQQVKTRAGTFDDCIRVVGRATMRLFADPVVGWRDLPLTTTEWYCKGVGLVRLERAEPAASTFLTGGTLRLELVSWQ
jgi:hypothetical protein